MKDNILNTTLIAFTFAAILVSAIGDSRSTPQTATAQSNREVKMEKTVVAARRLPSDITLVASAAR